MIAHDFATRLTSLAQLVHNVYARGFYHGALFMLAVVALSALYVYVGSKP